MILNGLESMKEALVTKAADFAGRPQDLMINHVTEGKGNIIKKYSTGHYRYQQENIWIYYCEELYSEAVFSFYSIFFCPLEHNYNLIDMSKNTYLL